MSHGYSALTAKEIKNRFETILQSELDQTVDFGRDTVEGQISATVALVLGDIAEASQAHYDQRRLQNATGHDLGDIVRLAGITRQSATQSTVSLEPIGTGGTDVPAGTEAQGPNGFTWEALEDGTVGGSMLFECQQEGPVDAPSGSNWEVVTPIKGLDDFNNSSPADPGRPREGDQALLQRRNREFAVGTQRQAGSVRSSLNDLDFIDATIVVENRKPYPQTKQLLDLPANSIGVVLYPTTLTSEQEKTAAETIYSAGPEAISTAGSESVSIESVDGSPISISFSYASTISVAVELNVVADPPSAEGQLESTLEAKVNSFFDQLGVGEDIQYEALVGALASIQNFDQVVDTGLRIGSPLDRNNVQIATTSVAVPSITVV